MQAKSRCTLGNDYRRYRQNVPRWLPKVKAWGQE